ncbi:MAG TPA: sigma-54 dependent transcriptional regulator [Polyangia bacterium]|jgi:two-component system response regulator PilR (NtrC family)|nr:sigma-54 dependent transcriptional regulator [Polyangia bacterium]
MTTPSGHILVVDDERSMREFLSIYLKRAGYTLSTASGAAEARAALEATEFDLVITDLQMPDGTGLDVLAQAKTVRPDTQVIVVTAYATAETAIAAMKAGAYDYLVKPFKLDEVGLVVERALERRLLLHQNVVLRDEIKGRYKLDRLLGKSPAMQRVFDLLRKIAPARTSVLVVGESGTGKELAARALHELSPRADRPFLPVNCGAIPETLIESELFGHVKGSFTGAASDKIGLFEAANGGTVMLDEVAELPLPMQVKLLRVLQERKVKPVGGVSEREIDVRVVAATNRDLETEVEKGAFRQDLYYRLNVIQVRMPPLRERREDVPLMVNHFVRKFSAEHGHPIGGVDPAAMSALTAYNFPGNVRELENLVERAVTLAVDGRITADALPELTPRPAAAVGVPDLPAVGFDLEKELETFERGIVLKALERTDGNRTEAARVLGISFRSMRYRMSKLGLSGADGEPGDATMASTLATGGGSKGGEEPSS